MHQHTLVSTAALLSTCSINMCSLVVITTQFVNY